MGLHSGNPPTLNVLQALQSGQKIVIDLDFADYMTDTEQRSICQQLGYCWHANCAARAPAHLALTSLHVRRRLDGEGCLVGSPCFLCAASCLLAKPSTADRSLCVSCCFWIDVLQGKMEEVMRKQISGYTNWQATVTDKVPQPLYRSRGTAPSCSRHRQRPRRWLDHLAWAEPAAASALAAPSLTLPA